MSALSTNTTLKGDGFKFNVRSYKIERVIDFSLVVFTASIYFELGTLKDAFVPRNIAIVELIAQDTSDESAATFGVYLKSDGSKLVERTLGSATGCTTAGLTKNSVTEGTAAQDGTVSGTAVTSAAVGAGGTLCGYVNNKPTSGKVKIVISGDLMTDYWDEALGGATEFDPAEHVRTNAAS